MFQIISKLPIYLRFERLIQLSFSVVLNFFKFEREGICIFDYSQTTLYVGKHRTTCLLIFFYLVIEKVKEVCNSFMQISSRVTPLLIVSLNNESNGVKKLTPTLIFTLFLFARCLIITLYRHMSLVCD